MITQRCSSCGWMTPPTPAMFEGITPDPVVVRAISGVDLTDDGSAFKACPNCKQDSLTETTA